MEVLTYVFMGAAGVLTILMVSAAAILGRSGRRIPEPIDKGYQVVVLGLVFGVFVNTLALFFS